MSPQANTQPPLAGQRALVTGGGSGIGLASASALARDGASVTLMGRDADKLERAAEALRPQMAAGAILTTAAGDVASEDEVRRAVETAAGAEGRLHIALANAGTGGLAPLLRTELDDWQRVLRVNLDGTFLTFKHAGAAIAASGGGALCAISSIAGLRTHRFMAAYCTSKAAVDMLVQNTADELGTAGVRCNAVCPGLVETELAQALFEEPTVFEDYLACMPIRRPGKVQDVAAAVRFLCGPESAWVTGVVLPVDGGHHLRRGPDVERFARMAHGDAGVDPGPTPPADR